MHIENEHIRDIHLEWCVRVDCQGNAPEEFNSQDIWKLFQGRVGGVTSVSESSEGGKRWMKVIFRGEDEVKKALCMSGYTIGSTSIQVSSFSGRTIDSFVKPRSNHITRAKREPDTRRNLYVLNVPHDLSAQAYRDLFMPHGTPTHTVLLKTHDSCSRRRGFVVMSNHHEAQDVINWLDGICIRGFQLRVTWANIDRSNGFMSGYDRTTFLGSGSNGIQSSVSAVPVPGTSTTVEPKSTGIGMDTSTVVASNIPISLFPENEIDILFKPFGLIKSIQLIPPNPSSNHPLSTLAPASPLARTAIVTYEKSADAIAAKNTLHGQVYEGFALAVGFVSKLGQEDPQLRESSAPPPLNAPISAANSHHASHYGFNSQQILAPPVAYEQTFRGVPTAVDYYDAVHAPYRNGYAHHPSHGNWTPYSPYMSQTLSHQPSQTFSSAPHHESELIIHPLHQNTHGGSHFPHYVQHSSMPW